MKSAILGLSCSDKWVLGKKGDFMKLTALILGLVLLLPAMAATRVKTEVKPVTIVLKSGVTKEQHMAAEANCKDLNSTMEGIELKRCVKQKLGLLK
jgi:hypothetical protein